MNLTQARLAEDDVRRVLVDLWDVSRSTFSLIGEISTAEYGTPEFWESVEAKMKVCLNYLCQNNTTDCRRISHPRFSFRTQACEEPYQTLRDEKKIQSWVSPLPPGQTGAVMVAAVGLGTIFGSYLC